MIDELTESLLDTKTLSEEGELVLAMEVLSIYFEIHLRLLWIIVLSSYRYIVLILSKNCLINL